MTLRVLIVEDDPTKFSHIVSVVDGCIAPSRTIEHVVDATAARRLLRAQAFDLLVLDLSLPQRPGDAPRIDVGLRLIEEIFLRSPERAPRYIVGISGIDEARELGSRFFSSRSLPLIRYDPTSDGWREELSSILHRTSQSLLSGHVPDPDYLTDIAIVCALATPELAQVKRLWAFVRHNVQFDDTDYWMADSVVGGRARRIVAAAAPSMGMAPAAVLATKMILHFRPRFIAMTGITGAVDGTCNLGDVLVADRSWDWGAGKWHGEEEAVPEFLPAPNQHALSPDVRNQFARIAADRHTLLDIKAAWPGDAPSHELAVRICHVATGAPVVASSETAKHVLHANRKTVGIEMEAFSIFTAAAEAPRPQPKAIVVKSVVDFANAEKADSVHAYASYTSARVLQRFVELLT